jgi:hypothetical protein
MGRKRVPGLIMSSGEQTGVVKLSPQIMESLKTQGKAFRAHATKCRASGAQRRAWACAEPAPRSLATVLPSLARFIFISAQRELFGLRQRCLGARRRDQNSRGNKS